MLKKRRLIFISLVLFFIIGLGFSIYFFLRPNTIIQSNLSERALEFIEKNEGELGKAVLTPVEKRVNEPILVPGCFSFTFPFELGTYREQEKCNWIYNTKNPIGRIVVRLRDANIESVDELPDVNFRKIRQEYSSSEKTLGGNQYLIFEKTENGYELSAFRIVNEKILTVSLTSQVNRGLSREFESLLESLKVLK